jgi:predicted RNA-binding protein YlxR (DUF448 family)
MKTRTIERNLKVISKTSKLHREELLRFVHRSEMAVFVYPENEALHPSQNWSRIVKSDAGSMK